MASNLISTKFYRSSIGPVLSKIDTTRGWVQFCFFVDLDLKAENREKVLVLNGYRGWRLAMLINLVGEQKEATCFRQDRNTTMTYACSINWKNQLHVFGGNAKQQISRLNGHKLARIGSLPFVFLNGACSVMAEKFIFLCFINSTEPKRCWRSTGPLDIFSERTPSNHDHHFTRTICSESELFCLMSH